MGKRVRVCMLGFHMQEPTAQAAIPAKPRGIAPLGTCNGQTTVRAP